MEHHQPEQQAAMDEHQMAMHYAPYYTSGSDANTYAPPSYQDIAYQQNMIAGPPQLQHLEIAGMQPTGPYMPTGVYAGHEHHSASASSPSSPGMYNTPLSPPISNGSDTSADNVYLSRNSSGATSPTSSRGSSLVHRTNTRYAATPSPTSSSGRGRRANSLSNSEGEDMNLIGEDDQHNRKEATRKQRIEAEQRRRDDLRDGYARMKNVLPISNQKNSKVMLLARATDHIKALTEENRQMQMRLAVLEQEVARLREVNDRLALGVATPTASGPMSPKDIRPLSPPPESHSLAEVAGHQAPREDSSDDEVDE